MPRPRTILITAAALFAGAATSGIGIAQADSSSTGATGASGATSTSTIVVNGTDTITIDSSSSNATIASTYQTALGDAITNADQKATFIAGQINATLGAVTNVTETSTSSNLCEGGVVFAQGTAVPETAKSTTPKSTTTAHHKKHKKNLPVIRAIVDPSSTSCNVEADVTVTYAIS